MPAEPRRLAYIDWMRGLACILMFQTHCYDAWLNEASRNSELYKWSQIGGTFPAPLFLFLAGISVAIVAQKLRKKGFPNHQIAQRTIRRGAEILGLGLLFRLQEYVISLGWAPWSDLLRVDVLNEIGVSMMLLGILCWIFHRENKIAIAAAATAAAVSMLSPIMWTTSRLTKLPWPLESYINGVHNLGKPQPWLFPIFPWSAFAFAGLAAGFLLITPWAQKLGPKISLGAVVAGVVFIFVGRSLEAQPFHLYSTDDFWHTSPNFFLIRVGFLLIFLGAAYAWCRWGWGQRGFSPLIQLGHTSLLVYWVHIEFVYGRFSILRHHGENISRATVGLLIIFSTMLLLSLARTHPLRQTVRL